MGKWIIDETYDDGYEHHKCSHCNTRALFDYIMEEDYDEGTDGEWEYLGMRDNGINEHITKFCPECGEKMDCSEAMFDIYGCKVCIYYDENSLNSGYTKECSGCGCYPWASDDLPLKYKYCR